MMRRIVTFMNQPFLLFILLSIFFAYLFPDIGAKGGLLKPEITVKYGAIIIIFLISGISLQTKELIAAAYQYHIHIFIQCFSFLCVPFVVQLLVQLLGQFYPNPDILIGFITVSCMPPPVSSAVLLTKSVGGNEAAAVFNSALGSFLGIMVTPALLYLFLSGSGNVPIWSAMFQLGFTVVFPVFIGQYARIKIESTVTRHKKKLSVIGSFMLLIIIYTTFCETFSKQDDAFSISTVIITSLAVILLQFFLLILAFYPTRKFHQYFSAEDSVAILYCSTHKSLTLGFPMLKVLYGNESQFILISFPLLVYHPMQILIGSMLVPALQKFIKEDKRTKGKLHSV